MKSPRNIPASVRQRILNRAKSDRRPFNELLQYYAMERFLYRLSQSAHADRFILKGALMLRVWHSPEFRPTMDIDMLGRTSNKEGDIIAQIRDILSMDVEADGLAFDADSIQAEAIRLTFEKRGTALPTKIEVFTEPFINAKQIQWTTFWKRLQQNHVSVSFRELNLLNAVLDHIANF